MAIGAVARVILMSALENALARELEAVTVTRLITRLSLSAASGTAVVAVGVIVQNANVALGVVGPVTERESDWFYWEEFVTGGVTGEGRHITRDTAGQRRFRGQESEMYYYIENRSASTAVDFHVSGRALILTP